MSQGKITPLIAAAELRAEQKSAAELHSLINAIDEQINELEQQLDDKLDAIVRRLVELEEEGVGSPIK